MNSKTVRLLRRYAVVKGVPTRTVKRAWNRIPRQLRHEARQAMEADTQ